MNDEPALAELLSSLFVQASLLRSWLRATFGVGFEDQLPGEIAPKTMVVDQATRLLFAAGLVNHELFEKLECREPSRAVDIWKVARACGVAPPSAQLERPAAHEGLAITVNLPPRVPGFVGRRGELAKLADLVESGLPAAVVQAPGAVTGLGGVGKTALVTQYVYANLVKFDCVVWLAAEGDDLPDRIAAVAPRIAPDLPVGLDVEGQAREVMMRLASMRRSLLVLDSVEHPENYLRWIPQTGNCQVLITSRRRDLHGVTRLDLEVLPADDALALLLGPLSYAEPELESARQLCVEFECLAVALALANRPLALGTWTPSQLLEWVREEGPTRWSNDAADVHGGVPGGIAGLFWHSEALLTAGKTQTDRWAHAMLMVGCFAADVAIEGEMLGIAAADYLETAQPRFIVRRALSRLYALGWISAGVGADVRIHRMVKDYFRSHASLEAQLAWGRAVTSRSLSETTNTDRLEEHRAHLRSLVEATRTSLDALQGERAREAAALMGMLDRFNRHVYRTSADRLLTAVLNLSMYLSPPQHWEEFRGERPGRSLPDELRQSHPQFAEVFSAGRQLVEQTHVTSILVGLAQSYLREVPVRPRPHIAWDELCDIVQGVAVDFDVHAELGVSSAGVSLPGTFAVWQVIVRELVTNISAHARLRPHRPVATFRLEAGIDGSMSQLLVSGDQPFLLRQPELAQRLREADDPSELLRYVAGLSTAANGLPGMGLRLCARLLESLGAQLTTRLHDAGAPLRTGSSCSVAQQHQLPLCVVIDLPSLSPPVDN